MLVAAGGPACVTYLLRRPESAYVDCQAMYTSENHPSNGSNLAPMLPEFIDDQVCKNATECHGASGRVSFGCKRKVDLT